MIHLVQRMRYHNNIKAHYLHRQYLSDHKLIYCHKFFPVKSNFSKVQSIEALVHPEFFLTVQFISYCPLKSN